MPSCCKYSVAERTAAAAIVAKWRTISEQELCSDLRDEPLPAFRKLNEEEKTLILKAALNLCIMVDGDDGKCNMECKEPGAAAGMTLDSVSKELDDIYAYDKKQGIDLQVWLIKALGVFVLIFLLFFGVAVLTGHMETMSVKDTWTLIKEIVDALMNPPS